MEREFIEKVWGREEIIENNSFYCGKILHLRVWHKCSMHHHKIKDETFYVLEGEIFLETTNSKMILESGDSFRIRPGLNHSFTGLTDAKIMEISTTDRADDSYREPGQHSKRLTDEEIRRVEGLCRNLRYIQNQV
jgi:mannose-6-phosphate isomerase-like protein (cupin superfamily)